MERRQTNKRMEKDEASCQHSETPDHPRAVIDPELKKTNPVPWKEGNRKKLKPRDEYWKAGI